MIIGVPKEIKNNENRVGMTPAGVAELVKKGHTAQPVSQFLILNSQITKFPEFFRCAAKRQQIHQRHVILVIGCQSDRR